MKKRLFSILTTLVMVISLFGLMPSMSVGALTSGDYEYEILDDGTVEITKYNGSATELTILSTIEGKKVTSIGDRAFDHCTNLESINIPESVKNIGDYAFWVCTSLKSIEIPKSVTEIGYSTFAHCTSLESVILPDGLISIGGYAFSDCTSLENLRIPDSVTDVEWRTFEGCTSLKEIILSENMTYIDFSLFTGCTSLKSLNIPKNISDIDMRAIMRYSLLEITVDEENQHFSAENGVLFNKDKTELLYYLKDNPRESYIVPNSVKVIGQNGFNSSKNLKSITLPDNLEKISYCAFENSDSITTITIPDSVTNIEDKAFSSCDNLKNIIIPENVTHIGEGAFSNCNSMTEIKVPKSVTFIEAFAFDIATLESIVVDKNNPNYSSEDGVFFNKDKTTLISYPKAKTKENYIIPNSVTNIYRKAFYDCDNLITIKIPEGVTTIEQDAFSNCDKLSSLTLPGGLRYVWSIALRCENLKTIIIEEGIESLNNTFYGCSNLESVELPSSLVEISQAFYHCSNLEDIYYTGTEMQWDNVKIDNNTNLTSFDDATVHYNYVRPESQLTANIYYQLKEDSSTIRFVTEVDIEDVQQAESGEYTISLNGESVDTQPITGAYKAIYANGELVEAPEGKCYVISKTYAGFSTDDSLTFEMNLSNYDKGVEREVIIN